MKKIIASLLIVASSAAMAAFSKNMSADQLDMEVAKHLSQGETPAVILEAAAAAGLSPKDVLASLRRVAKSDFKEQNFQTAGGSSFAGGGGGSASRN